MPRPSAKRNRAKSRTPDRRTEKQLELLSRLKHLAEATGLEVREERLMREAGYSVHSGVCRVKGREVLILDRNLAPGERIEAAVAILADRDLDSMYIEPAMREFLNGGRPPADVSEADGGEVSDGGPRGARGAAVHDEAVVDGP